MANGSNSIRKLFAVARAFCEQHVRRGGRGDEHVMTLRVHGGRYNAEVSNQFSGSRFGSVDEFMSDTAAALNLHPVQV